MKNISKHNKCPCPKLGVIRLDYNYPPAKGDIDCPDSFPYDVIYKVVPGLTFEMCQSGVLSREVEERFKSSIRWLAEEKKVSGISGDCGFMMYLQPLAREVTNIPVFMSSLCLLEAMMGVYSHKCQIIVLTANRASLEPMRGLIKTECGGGGDTHDNRYHIVGCEDVAGFEAVAHAEKVDTKKVEPGVVRKAQDALKQFPDSRAFLLECTELPPYADAIRCSTGLPVYDVITTCNFFIGGLQDDVRFGLNNWQRKRSRRQRGYAFGDNLSEEEKRQLVSKRRAPYISRFSRYSSRSSSRSHAASRVTDAASVAVTDERRRRRKPHPGNVKRGAETDTSCTCTSVIPHLCLALQGIPPI